MLAAIAVLCLHAIACRAQHEPPPPNYEPELIEVVELPLPPVSASNETGACTPAINPHGTGCIRRDVGEAQKFQAGDFTPDGNHVVATVEFVGAPASPDSAGVFVGTQLILVKTDGSNFSNGDPWKCLSCGVPGNQARGLDSKRNYPHVFRSGDKALWGHNILDCGGHQLASDECTPNRTHIYPIRWETSVNGSGPGGALRELRLHPDDKHLGWSSFTSNGGQNCFFGRLEFNSSPQNGEPLVPRYDLVDVNLLFDPNRSKSITVNGTELLFHDDAIAIGELRGFSGTGDEILYIGLPREANNIDLFAIHIITGEIRRLTSHPEYADPIAFSWDNEWFVTMDTRGSNRQMWMSGLRYIPPLIDLVTISVAASTRNNGPRRFFQPILLDRYGDRENYFGQQVNSEGDASNGAVNDPNWNGRADPAFSPDGTQIVYWQALVSPPACGGNNPLECPVSNAQGQREYRIMLARRWSQAPKDVPPVFRVPEHIPWATSFPPGAKFPDQFVLPVGNYTLRGKASGTASVQLLGQSSSQFGGINSVSVTYANFSDDGHHVLNGWENATRTILLPNVWNNKVDWYCDLLQTQTGGGSNGTKRTGPEGFHVQIDVLVNVFNANGTLRTTVGERVYEQPENGT